MKCCWILSKALLLPGIAVLRGEKILKIFRSKFLTNKKYSIFVLFLPYSGQYTELQKLFLKKVN